MSYSDYDQYPDYDESMASRRTPSSLTSPIVIVGVLVLLGLGIYKFPEIRKQWLESDPEFMLRMRAVEARAEADRLYRQREAELKAQAEAAGARLARLELPRTPIGAVAARVGPAVVSIATVSRDDGNQLRPFFHQGPFRFEQVPKRSEGSGVIVRIEKDRVYVLTNNHVVRDAHQVEVALASGRKMEIPTDHIYADQLTDLAVLWFERNDLDHLTVAEFGDSDEAGVGEPVIAIGSPFGLEQSVTAGIISAKGRLNPRVDAELIQTDAAMNPGNSGGPLVDMKGRVLGINTMIYSRNGGSQGIGFAVPANTAKWVVDKLVSPPHRIVRGFVGMSMDNLTEESALRLGVQSGVVVRQVLEGYPASEAGIQPGDVLFRYNGTPIKNWTHLRKMIMDTPPGRTASIHLIRIEDGKPVPHTIKVTVTERSD